MLRFGSNSWLWSAFSFWCLVLGIMAAVMMYVVKGYKQVSVAHTVALSSKFFIIFKSSGYIHVSTRSLSRHLNIEYDFGGLQKLDFVYQLGA